MFHGDALVTRAEPYAPIRHGGHGRDEVATCVTTDSRRNFGDWCRVSVRGDEAREFDVAGNTMRFADRVDAGRQLVRLVEHLAGPEAVVLGLPRGGIPVAREIADALGLPLDVIIVRKLGVPGQPELAMGAIGEGGVRVMNGDVLSMTGVSDEEVSHVESRERGELERRRQLFRQDSPMVDLAGRTALIVDDGIATGATARAACAVARAHGAARVVLAVPVAPQGWIRDFSGVADELVCLHEPSHFLSVGHFYENFAQVSDADVVDILRSRRRGRAAHAVDAHDVTIDIGGGRRLGGVLAVPASPIGCVIFAHGSGSSRHSPRNAHVADVLNRHGMATLLFDLLTEDEADERSRVFDVRLLAGRLEAVVAWAGQTEEVRELPVALFGASTGAAAALVCAASPASDVAAVVSRGGRADLAGDALHSVRCPVLLIVGEDDTLVLSWNRSAKKTIGAHCELRVIPRATHLFEEPGTLEKAADAAAEFLEDVFSPGPGRREHGFGGSGRAASR